MVEDTTQSAAKTTVKWVVDMTHCGVCDVGSNPVITTYFVLLSTPNRSVSQHGG